MDHRPASSPLMNEVSKFIYKVTPAEFKKFKSQNKEKYFFIFSKSIDRWLVTDRSRKLANGMFATIGRYYTHEREFRTEEKIEGFSELQAGQASNSDGS